jgi:hypothetical protein
MQIRDCAVSRLIAVVVAGVVGLICVPQPAAALGFGELSVVSRSADRADLFGIENSAVLHFWQSEAPSAWEGPESVGGATADISALMLVDDRFEVFAVGPSNEILRSGQDDGFSWSQWQTIPGGAKRVAAAKAEDGRVGLFYVGTDDAVWAGLRNAPVAESVSDATSFADAVQLGFTATQLAATAAPGGGFALFATDADGAVWFAHFDPAATEPPAWENLGGQASAIAAVLTQSGNYELAAIGRGAGITYAQSQTAAGWTGWVSAGGAGNRIELVELNGALTLVTLQDDGTVSRANRALDGTWSAWTSVAEASPFETKFEGTALVTIPDQDVSEDRTISLGIRFSVDRRRVEISSFPPIQTESFDTPFGSTRSTVTLDSSSTGEFDPDSGRLVIPVTLEFDQSLDVPLINEDARAAFELSTEAQGGAAFDRETSDLTLAAQSTFEGIGGGINPLDGLEVHVAISGALDPAP